MTDLPNPDVRAAWGPRAALAAIALLIALTVFHAPVKYTEGDAWGTVFVSQVLVRDHTLRLDAYADRLGIYGYRVIPWRGHLYNIFPVGTPLVVAPYVALRMAMGRDMARDEAATQVELTALTSVAIFLLLYRLARLHLAPWPAVLAAAAMWAGSSYASTGATALWSHNLAAIFAMLAIHHVFRAMAADAPLGVVRLAAALFAAYLCRPTLGLLAVAVVAAVFLRRRGDAVRIAVGFAAGLAAFSAWSVWELGVPLHLYYVGAIMRGGSFLVALHTNLFSPARGLFVYSPFLALPVLLHRPVIAWLRANAWSAPILVGWPIVHLLSVSRVGPFWAGWCYGPRFMTDVLPALFLLVVIALAHGGRLAPAWRVGGAAAVAVAIYLNGVQGLGNPWTKRWNAEPDIDVYPHYALDWRYPPFLHDAARHEARKREFLGDAR